MRTCCLVTWGASASGVLKILNQRLNQSLPIIAVMDDFRMGPLQDADHSPPTRRIDWYRDIWRAQWWVTSQEDETALHELWVEHQNRLHAALSSSHRIIAWIGNNAHDQLMLAMIASLATPQTELSVVDITRKVPNHHQGNYTIGICRPVDLLQLQPKRLIDKERAALSERWQTWTQHGQGWRQIDADGQIVEYPLDALDEPLLKKVAECGPCSSARIVGEIMGQHPGMVPDSFLFWRLGILQQAGLVAFTPQSGPQPRSPHVSLA